MIYEFNDYRQFLKQVVVDRKVKNPLYSVKVLARQIGLAPSTISEVLSKKKNLSLNTAMEVAEKLSLKGKEVDYFCLLVQLETAKNEEQKASLLSRLTALNPKRPVHNLNVDAFKVISDWYHLAILGTLNLPDFDFSIENIAHSLSITKLEAETAIERLLRLALIEKDVEGKFRRTVTDLFIHAPVSNTGVNNYFRQMLRKAVDSIDAQTPKERLIRTENIAIHETQLAEADALIEEFVTKMSALSSKSKRNTKLYHLGTQFFCLAQTKGKKP